MMPVFVLKIVHTETGNVAHLPAGGALEADLINLCTAHIVAKGVGLFRSEKHVKQSIHDGIKDAIMSLKEQTKHIA